jgi:hypothetical protein
VLGIELLFEDVVVMGELVAVVYDGVLEVGVVSFVAEEQLLS